MNLAPDQFERILRTLQGPPVAHEKRRAERFPISTAIDFARMDDASQWAWTRGLTHDISEIGLGLISADLLQRGERVAVRLPDGGSGQMTIGCTVAHSRMVAQGLYCAGLEFAELLDAAAAPPLPERAARPLRRPRKPTPAGKS